MPCTAPCQSQWMDIRFGKKKKISRHFLEGHENVLGKKVVQVVKTENDLGFHTKRIEAGKWSRL